MPSLPTLWRRHRPSSILGFWMPWTQAFRVGFITTRESALYFKGYVEGWYRDEPRVPFHQRDEIGGP